MGKDLTDIKLTFTKHSYPGIRARIFPMHYLVLSFQQLSEYDSMVEISIIHHYDCARSFSKMREKKSLNSKHMQSKMNVVRSEMRLGRWFEFGRDEKYASLAWWAPVKKLCS